MLQCACVCHGPSRLLSAQVAGRVRTQLVSESRLLECLELLRAEQERSKRLLALMNAHEQSAAERTDKLRMQVALHSHVLSRPKSS